MTWFVVAWRWLKGSQIAQAALAIMALIGWHKHKTRQARNEGRDEEQRRVRDEYTEQRKEIEHAAQEIDRDHSDLDRDDLRQRMRDSATDSNRR